jgi:hypothetical protein
MTEQKEEVKEPIIGNFKPKRKFLNFVSAVNGAKIRFIRDIAFLKGEKLSGILEGVVFKITICDEGTIKFEEVDTKKTDEAMIGRLINDIDEMNVTGYTQKFVVSGLEFSDVDGKLCYLEVENEKPIDKLRGLFDEPKVEISSKGLSLLDQLLGDVGDEDTTEETEEVQETQTKNKLVENEATSFMEEQFRKMNEEKTNELKSRVNQKETEVIGYQRDISTAETRLKKTQEDLRILQTRLDSMTPGDEPNGWVFYISEEQKLETGLDENTKSIADKIADIMNLKKDVLFDYLTGSFYKIKIAKADDINTDVKEVDSEILEKIFKVDIEGKFTATSQTEFEYRGNLNWHQLVGKMIRSGFQQNPDFDKLCESNSYTSKEEENSEVKIETKKVKNTKSKKK